MITIHSKGFWESVINGADIMREPELYPPEVVEAFKRFEAHWLARANGRAPVEPPDEFGIEGYIVGAHGVVGVHPSASDEVKGEWMAHWTWRKEHPHGGGC
ncbi:MAG: hypothetical protein FWH47_05315 [Methanomassiliicoccaceae archaeon]|nr:hypothetical protein [Methanomassiliicoccaceae archaeon]